MKENKHQIQKQQCYSLCWKLPKGTQSFVFCWQIATFLLVSKIKMTGMQLNVVYHQVHRNI